MVFSNQLLDRALKGRSDYVPTRRRDEYEDVAAAATR
jgi:hypothetical protein